jgi:hypothetical protein
MTYYDDRRCFLSEYLKSGQFNTDMHLFAGQTIKRAQSRFCQSTGVSPTDGPPSNAERECLTRNIWQLDPHFRTNPSGSRHGSVVPMSCHSPD